MANKKEAVATEVIGLDGKKTIFKNETSAKDEVKPTKSVKRTGKSTTTKNEDVEKKSTKKTTKTSTTKSTVSTKKTTTKTKSSTDDKVVEKEKKTTTKKSPTKKKIDQDFSELIEKLSAELIENLGKVFVKIDDCQRIVIQTIQMLAVNGVQNHIAETEAKLDEQLAAAKDGKAESTDPA